MEFSNVHLLLLIVFLFYLSGGIIASTLAHEVAISGATFFIQGMVIGVIYMLQTIGRQFIALFERSKKSALNFCLISACGTFITFIFWPTMWIFIMGRLYYTLYNQVVNISKEYVGKMEVSERNIIYCNLVESMRVAGLSIGNVAGGYIYLCHKDFSSLCLYATVLTSTAILLMQYIDEDPDGQKPETNFLEIPSNCIRRLENLKTIKYKKHWDSILLQASYTTTFSIYFIRYCFIITYNYKIGTVLIGYSIAYQHLWLFATSFLIPFIKRRTKNKKLLFEHSLLISGFILSGLYYAPSYECFLVIQIPMLFCFVLTNSLLEEDALGLKQEGVHEISGTISYLVNVFGPITFGIICEYVGGSGFKALSLLPIVICIYILNQRFLKTRHIEIVEGEEEQPESSRVKED